MLQVMQLELPADRRPHTGPKQRTRERVNLLPLPNTKYSVTRCGERGWTATKLLIDWPKTAPFVSVKRLLFVFCSAEKRNALANLGLRRLRTPAARLATTAFLAAAIRVRHKDVAHVCPSRRRRQLLR